MTHGRRQLGPETTADTGARWRQRVTYTRCLNSEHCTPPVNLSRSSDVLFRIYTGKGREHMASESTGRAVPNPALTLQVTSAAVGVGWVDSEA